LTSRDRRQRVEPDLREALLLRGLGLLGELLHGLLARLEVLPAEVDEEVVAGGDDPARELGGEAGEGDLPVEAGELVGAVVAQRAVEGQLERVADGGRCVVEEDPEGHARLRAGQRLDLRQRPLRVLRRLLLCATAGGGDGEDAGEEQEERATADGPMHAAQRATGIRLPTGPGTGPERKLRPSVLGLWPPRWHRALR
jgi:hypothetical protein